MLLDALAWVMLTVIRVELIFNCHKLRDIYLSSSFKSPRGQYALAAFAITCLAQFTVQFQFNWLLRIYAIYLTVGICSWLYRRVYFYHRKLDSLGVNQTINNFDAQKYQQAVITKHTNTTPSGDPVVHHQNAFTSTFKPHKSKSSGAASSASSNGSSSSASSPELPAANGCARAGGLASLSDTNSLQRQRAVAYRDFRSLLTEPRQNHKEFALSLTHLASISSLLGDKDVFDEMHFQLLATRRDVANILLRSVLLFAATILAYAS